MNRRKLVLGIASVGVGVAAYASAAQPDMPGTPAAQPEIEQTEVSSTAQGAGWQQADLVAGWCRCADLPVRERRLDVATARGHPQ